MVPVSIPTKLILEILSRLPATSIARFHCMSKTWASMLRRPYFIELFLTRSSAQPRLLFAIEGNDQWSFFSLPQHHSPYEKSSSSSIVVATEFHMKFPPYGIQIYHRSDRRFSCGYASGLMYFYGMYIKEEDYDGVHVICNPKTGRYETLPTLKRFRQAFSFFGFDPIDKQYKVLFVAYPCSPDLHKVLTVGTEEMRWRKIKSPLRHDIASEGIYIYGVVYYLGDTSEVMTAFVVFCFDVRSEKFKIIYPKSYCELINYKGKLGLVYYDDYADDAIELRVWVLEDEDKQEWSKYAYTLRDDKFLAHYVSIVGMSATGEIILSMTDYTSKQPFYIFYFNPERNTIQRVEIQGFGEYHEAIGNRSRVHVFVDDCSRFYPFADHVEYINVIDSKLLTSSPYRRYEESSSSDDDIYHRYEAEEYDYDYDYDDDDDDDDEYYWS